MANNLIRICHEAECSCLGCHSLIRCLHCMFLVKVARNQKYMARAAGCTSVCLPKSWWEFCIEYTVHVYDRMAHAAVEIYLSLQAAIWA